MNETQEFVVNCNNNLETYSKYRSKKSLWGNKGGVCGYVSRKKPLHCNEILLTENTRGYSNRKGGGSNSVGVRSNKATAAVHTALSSQTAPGRLCGLM